ncbi:MAG TPA: helix-turn-helix domain-containing protein [Candidatus Baltobacteraceae bacterium]|nr:helix-turn-helix domain-containing protein [Candidatus Baltobacteraceae bacterium]
MGKRVYGQYCGFARALELVGERWALMVLRDLFVAPKRFSELKRGLPGIPSNVLSRRLKEMEAAGIVQRRILPRPHGVVYELTKTGAALEPAVVELGRWGAKALGQPRNGEVITVDALVMALRSTFQPKAAKGVTVLYELRVGPNVLHASIVRGRLTVEPGTRADADLTMEIGPALRDLLAGELLPHEAVRKGLAKIRGNRAHLDRFVELFKI